MSCWGNVTTLNVNLSKCINKIVGLSVINVVCFMKQIIFNSALGKVEN